MRKVREKRSLAGREKKRKEKQKELDSLFWPGCFDPPHRLILGINIELKRPQKEGPFSSEGNLRCRARIAVPVPLHLPAVRSMAKEG